MNTVSENITEIYVQLVRTIILNQKTNSSIQNRTFTTQPKLIEINSIKSD